MDAKTGIHTTSTWKMFASCSTFISKNVSI